MTLDELIQSIFRPQQPVQPGAQPSGDMALTAPFGDVPAPDSGKALEGVSYAGGPKSATNAKPPVAPNTGLSGPSTLDQVGNFLAGLGRGGGALLPAIGGGMQTVRAAETNATANNKTFQALIGAGVDRTVAEAAIGNPELMKALLQQKFGGGKYGKTGAVFQDQDGAFKTLQFAEDGTIKITPLQGLAPARGVKTVDDGTGTQIISGATGETVRRVEKNIVEKEKQEEVGKGLGQREVNRPKVEASIRDLKQQRQLVRGTIDEVLSNTDWTTAGAIGSASSIIPGTPAYNLARKLETIKSNIGFDKLQSIRDNSPTGGALGPVSDMENRLLQSVIASLDAGQSPSQLRQNLLRVKQQLDELDRLRDQAFNDTYGGAAATAGDGGGSRVRTYNPATGKIE